MVDKKLSDELKVFPQRVTFIRYRGEIKKATTGEGYEIIKEDEVFVKQIKKIVKCMDYHGEHFVYLDPEFDKGKVGGWFAFCTCGSPAVLLGGEFLEENYEWLACHFHVIKGFHQTTILQGIKNEIA